MTIETKNGRFKRKEVPYSQVSNQALRDENLSLKAKGLYSMIQSYITIPNFTLYKKTLYNKCLEKETSFENTWKELKEKGYLVQHKIRDEQGKFYYEYELLDFVEKNHTPENHPLGFQDVENPTSGKVGVYKKSDFNKNELNKNKARKNNEKKASDELIKEKNALEKFEKNALEELVRNNFQNINKNSIKNISKYTNSFRELIEVILYMIDTKKNRDVAILIALLRDKDYKKFNNYKENNKNIQKTKREEIKIFSHDEDFKIKETSKIDPLEQSKVKLSTEIMTSNIWNLPTKILLTNELSNINNLRDYQLFTIKVEKLKVS